MTRRERLLEEWLKFKTEVINEQNDYTENDGFIEEFEVSDNNFAGVWVNLTNNSGMFGPQFYFLWDKVFGSKQYNNLTFGSQIDVNSGEIFSGTGEFAYQTGNAGTADIKAMMYALNVFAQLENTQISGGVDYLSGQDNSSDVTLFNTLYATNHKFYGFMDFFLNLPVHTSGGGLTDFNAKIVLPANENLKLIGAFHLLNSSEKVAGKTSFGKEFDIVAIYNYGDGLQFQVGGGMFLPGEIFKTAPKIGGDDPAYWGFLQTSFALK